MLENLSGLIIHLIQSAGYVGIFFLMTLESALLPIPSEVTMPFAGFLVHMGQFNFWAVVFIGALGNLLGSLLAFALGYYLEEGLIVSHIEKWGKYILVSKHEYLRAVHWFQKYGNTIAFFSRLLPAVRTFISLPAGLSEMNVFKFGIYTFLGSFIWSTFLTWIGFYLGSKWNLIHPYFQKFQLVVIVLLIIGILWYINHKLKIFKFKRAQN